MCDSIHTARWINQLNGLGWDIHLFPSIDIERVHPDLKNVTVHRTFYGGPKYRDESVRLNGIPVISEDAAFVCRLALKKLRLDCRRLHLSRVIRKLRPDIIHSIEMQAAGYLTMDVRRKYAGQFPPWIYSSWGSDLYFFGRYPKHQARIREVLASCDYYIADCQRDVELAAKYGFRGHSLGVFPAAGGYDISDMRRWVQPGPVSSRRVIALKGYMGWAGRANVALQALELCSESLKGYKVALYLASPKVRRMARHAASITGAPFTILPPSPNQEIIKLMGSSRIAIGVNVTDGTPASLLEAMAMGAFPIQSDTVSSGEWIKHGENGLLVPPEDPQAIAAAIQRALSDDSLVDRAAEINSRLILERIDRSVIQPRIIAMYERIAASSSRQKKQANI